MNASLLEPIADTIPLTSAEKIKFVELETVVETHIDSFMLVGRALSEIRSRRLYRVHYSTFEVYVQERWGLPRSKANELIHSFGCAELLLSTTGAPDSPNPLPPRICEGVVRPIAKLDGDELRAQTWRLVSTVSRHSHISLRSASNQVVHMVREAIRENENSENGRVNGHKGAVPPKAIFVRSIVQLSRSDGFDPQLTILHLKTEQEAQTIYQACQLVSERCFMVQAQLEIRYPQLRCHPALSNG